MQLPDIEHNFSDALIEDVSFGPRREMTLKIQLLKWVGCSGVRGDLVVVRFGGIVNFEEVNEFFASSPHLQSELAHITYDKNQKSKLGHMFFDLTFERIEARIVVECSSVRIA